MAQVLDYSAGFPGAHTIRDAGYTGAVRYIGFPDRRKCATAGELADFTANRIGMALIYENTLTEWRGGYGAGQSAGERARGHARSIGFPDHRPIYLAIDQDVVTSGEFGVMLDHLRGAGTTVGGSGLLGVYGEADAIDRARDAGVARYFWQTAAWSRGRRTSAHLFQHVGTVHVGGIACDVNDVLADDWGQHNFAEDDVAFNDEIAVSAPSNRSYVETHSAAQVIGDTYFWAADTYRAVTGVIVPAVAALAAAATGGEQLDQAEVMARIDTAVRDASSKTVAGNVIPALKDALTEVLGPDRAAESDAIVAALERRLTPPSA